MDAAQTTNARTRLDLPWQLPHYRPLNGPHPLVASYVRGNVGVNAVALTSCAAVQQNHCDAVQQRMALQAAN